MGGHSFKKVLDEAIANILSKENNEKNFYWQILRKGKVDQEWFQVFSAKVTKKATDGAIKILKETFSQCGPDEDLVKEGHSIYLGQEHASWIWGNKTVAKIPNGITTIQ